MIRRPSRQRAFRSAAAWVVGLLLVGLVFPTAGLAQPRETAPASPAAAASHNGCGGTDSYGIPPDGDFSISGRVTNGSGDGIEGIRVRVRTVASPYHQAEDQHTNPDGDFTFLALTDEDFVLSFYDENGTYQNGFWSTGGLAVSPGAATPIDAGSNPTANIVLPAEPDPLPVISGTIRDSAGEAVEGVSVRADSLDFPVAGCDETDVDGKYEMVDVHVGRYTISVNSQTQPTGYYATAPSDHFVIRSSEASILTVLSDLPETDIKFPVTYTLSGEIKNAANDGVEEISVTACEELEGGLCSSGRSGVGGTFTLTNLVAGSYVIAQNDSTFVYASGYHVPGGVVADRSLATVIPVSGNVTNVALAAVANPRITGTVTDPQGAQLEGIQVSACLASDDLECNYGATVVGGTFALRVNPASYVLQMNDPSGDLPAGYIGADGVEVASVDDALLVTVGASDEDIGTVAFAEGGRIKGTTTIGGSAAPFVGFVVCRGDESDCVTGGESNDSGLFESRAVFPDDYILGHFTDAGLVWYVLGGPATTDPGLATTIPVGTTDFTGILFDVPPSTIGEPTPDGDNVNVTLTDPATDTTPIKLTFDHVNAPGETFLTVTDTGPGPGAPAGFQLGVPPTFFDISTTADFEGSEVTICISYVGVSFSDESQLRLFHHDASTDTWEDKTTSLDVVNDEICGRTDSFSPFAIFERTMAFAGFEPPIEDLPALNRAKGGDNISIGFSLGGDFGLSVLASGSPASQQRDCVTGEPIGAVEPTTSADKKDHLKYDTRNDVYSYKWKTTKSFEGTCRQLILTLSNGTTAEAAFDFRPEPPKPPKPPKTPKAH